MYVFGCKLSLFRLCDSDFGITAVDAVDNITIGIIYYYYYYYYVFCHKPLLPALLLLNNVDPHRSGFKFHTAVLSLLYMMFQV
jgi:hypothetical protein